MADNLGSVRSGSYISFPFRVGKLTHASLIPLSLLREYSGTPDSPRTSPRAVVFTICSETREMQRANVAAAWKQRRAAREVHPRLEPCAAQVISCRDRIKTSFQSDSVAAVGLYVPHTAGHAGCQRRKEGSLRERRRLAEFVNYAGAIATGRHRRPPRTSLRPNSCMELSQGEARANPKPASMIPPGHNDSPSHVMHPLTVGVVRFIQHGTEQRLRLWLAFQFVLKN